MVSLWYEKVLWFDEKHIYCHFPLLIVKGPLGNHKKFQKIKEASFKGSNVSLRRHGSLWPHQMKPYKILIESPLCCKMVHLILKNKQKWECYREFNTSVSSKNGKNLMFFMALTRKPYNIWGSNCGWLHMTTSTSYKLSFVQFWGGNVEILVELIWSYPYMYSQPR